MTEQMLDNDDAMLRVCGLTRRVTYKVPDGYFDTLTGRIMERIPKQETRGLILGYYVRDAFKYWIGAGVAASLLLGFIGVRHFTHHGNDPFMFASEEQYAYDFMDYGMVDTNDIYTYLNGDDF